MEVFIGILAVGLLVLAVSVRWMGRKDVPGRERVRRGTRNAMLGLQEFIAPSVEYVLQAQNVEQKEEEDDEGLGVADERAIRSNLSEALSRTSIDPEEVRWHLAAAVRVGLDWEALFERATRDELQERPYRAPIIPPAWLVAPRE